MRAVQVPLTSCARVVRRHSGCGRRNRPAGGQYGRLCNWDGGGEERHALGLGHAHSDRILFGIRSAADSGISGVFEKASQSRAKLLGTFGTVYQPGDESVSLDPGIVCGKRSGCHPREASIRSPKAIRPCCIWPSFRNGLPTSNPIGQRKPLSRASRGSTPMATPGCHRSWRTSWMTASHRLFSLSARRWLLTPGSSTTTALPRRNCLVGAPSFSVKNPRVLLPELPEGVVAFDYAPFSLLFPRAAAIVHHGGIGTTGQAMRSGRPSLVMPCAWDQPDNAERAARLGIARTIARNRYEPTSRCC